MKITILCSDVDHPISPWLVCWMDRQRSAHDVEIVNKTSELSSGDILFLISCHELVQQVSRSRYKAVLVIHASNLPHGRGWSPHIWQILEKKRLIKVTLLEAEDKLDTGAIWTQDELHIEDHETYNEINSKLFGIEMLLMDFAVQNWKTIKPQPQPQLEPTTYPRRFPSDSRIDPTKSIEDQFDLLRVSDTKRFPAFFELHGHRYVLQMTKDVKNEEG